MVKPRMSLQERAARRADRRIVLLVTSFGFLLFLAVFLCLPNVGPLFRVYSMTAGSMQPTLPVGSHVLVSRASYGYSRYSFDSFELPVTGRWPASTPQRGDLIALRLPRDHRTHYLKRVVGLPGDRVQMIKNRLWLNGAIVPTEPGPEAPDPPRNQTEAQTFLETLPGGATYHIMRTGGESTHFGNTAEFLVPAGHLFVLGDNRDNSTDSREQSPRYGVGFVPIELVIGRVIATF